MKSSVRHQVFEIACSLTSEQATWLKEQVGKLFDHSHVKDELVVELDATWEEALVDRRTTYE